MNDAEKKTAVLVALVKAGIVDLDSFADGLVERLPKDFDANNLGPDLGASGGSLIGPWFALVGAEHLES